MSVFTTQGYKFRLVAGSGSYEDRTQLDLFADEEIKVSNNITDLFDIGAVPGTFTRTITLPGTKRNNAFFEQFYDISVVEPDVFSTNQKVEAYLDFDGIYLVTGYLQLQKVSVYENKFVDSYEINIFGIVSNFSTDAQRLFLTDLDNLSTYNHTSSLANISASWQGNLFSGSIRYALTDSGTGIYYSLEKDFLGIDDNEGSLSVQQFKPAIKVKTVWDACFSKLGFTYTSSFFNEPIFDNMYMLLNNNLKYPVYPNIQLENLAVSRATVITGSFGNISLPSGSRVGFPANSKEYDPTNVLTIGSPLKITIPKNSKLDARLNLVFSVTNTGGAGSGMPAFYLHYTGSGYSNTQTLANINTYLTTIQASRTTTVSETFELPLDFRLPTLPADTPISIFIEQIPFGVNNFSVTLNPITAKVGSSLQIRSLNQGADNEILNVPFNMPFGTSGIKIIDFIRGIQKKFNLVMYEDKQVPNQFKVETFNTWYKQGEYKDFNRYINLDEKIEFIPANSLAVNKLDFTDTQDTDFVSTVWQRTYNRTFGQAILINTGSYFSQGEFAVKSTLASGPLTSVPGAVFTGSYATGICSTYQINYGGSGPLGTSQARYTACNGTPATQSMGGGTVNAWICARTGTVKLVGSQISWTLQGDCDVAPSTGSNSQYPMFIPYYISNPGNEPARVMPRLMFYNGLLPATRYWIDYLDSGSVFSDPYYQYPYFDNYSVVSGSALPSTSSLSLLYNNETPSLGTAPIENLISTYWQTYLELLYNPRTRLVNAAAVIPLADYFQIELNDLVQFRSNYYHLRAINDYNLTTGQCAIQLLGPVIPDTVSNVLNFRADLAIASSGGIVSTFWSGSFENPIHYTSIRFTSGSGSLTVTGTPGLNQPNSKDVQLLVVGGGGAGGGGFFSYTGVNSSAGSHGGGGGGGLIFSGSYALVTGSYSIVVGSGGIPLTSSQGGNGGNSSFNSIIAYGGGGGGSQNTPGDYTTGRNGGSGGGSSNYNIFGAPSASSGIAGQGNAGGVPTPQQRSGAGGGGAAVAGGANTTGAYGGIGGLGGSGSAVPQMEYYNIAVSGNIPQQSGYNQSPFDGTNDVYQLDSGFRKLYAGGGGGGIWNNSIYNVGGPAGPGGGGGGASWIQNSGESTYGIDALGATGGGGGGGGYMTSQLMRGGYGGGGTVIVAFPTFPQPATSNYDIEYLVVGGGGMGGSITGSAGSNEIPLAGGGGGGGQVLTGSFMVYSERPYGISVFVGASDVTSSFTSSIAQPGGRGGSISLSGSIRGTGGNGANGGGGASVESAIRFGGTGSINGYPGGSAVSVFIPGDIRGWQGGGGGGAAQSGSNAIAIGTYYSGSAGNGGSGSMWLNGVIYGSGGGGATYNNDPSINSPAGIGSNGGGTGGSNTATGGFILPTAGTPNTGAGGGGGVRKSFTAPASLQGAGAPGGSGVVVVRYLGGQKGSGGTVTYADGYTYHTFTTTGPDFFIP